MGNQALVICRVTPGSVASRCGLETGDVIISVEGQFVSEMSQEMCENLVKGARGSLNIVVEKPVDPSLNVDRSVYLPNSADTLGPHVPGQVVDVPVFDPNAMKKSANKKMMLMQGPGQSKVVHAQYNTPLDMYSNSNIVDSVHAQGEFRYPKPTLTKVDTILTHQYSGKCIASTRTHPNLANPAVSFCLSLSLDTNKGTSA